MSPPVLETEFSVYVFFYFNGVRLEKFTAVLAPFTISSAARWLIKAFPKGIATVGPWVTYLIAIGSAVKAVFAWSKKLGRYQQRRKS